MRWTIDQKASLQASPAVLPSRWSQVGAGRYVSIDGVRVMLGVERHEGTGERWLHVSVSRQHAVPSHRHMREVKNIFIGREKKAVMIWPPDSEHIDDHPHCLHLWARWDGEMPLPDFRRVVRGRLTL